MLTIAFSALTSANAIASPAGSMRRITSGETGSLKRKVSAAGGTGTTVPSAGSDATSDACASACVAVASAISAPSRTRRTCYCFGNSFSAGAGSG